SEHRPFPSAALSAYAAGRLTGETSHRCGTPLAQGASCEGGKPFGGGGAGARVGLGPPQVVPPTIATTQSTRCQAITKAFTLATITRRPGARRVRTMHAGSYLRRMRSLVRFQLAPLSVKRGVSAA